MPVDFINSLIDVASSTGIISDVTSFIRGTSLQANGEFPTLITGNEDIVSELIEDIDKRPRGLFVTDFYTDNETRLVGDIVTAETLEPVDIDYSVPNQGALSPNELEHVINAALDIHRIDDTNDREKWTQVLTLIAENESQSTPSAVNTWDSNYVGKVVSDGHKYTASRGVFQVIPDTFSHYHQPGTSNGIYDPVAQAAAVINYLGSRYNADVDSGTLNEFYTQRYPMYKGY